MLVSLLAGEEEGEEGQEKAWLVLLVLHQKLGPELDAALRLHLHLQSCGSFRI